MNINIDSTIDQLQALNDAMRGYSNAFIDQPTVELEEIMSGADFTNRILDVVDADDLDSAAVEASLEIDTDQTNEIDSACWDWIDKTLGIKDGKTHPQQAIDFHERMSQEVANRMRSDSESQFEEAYQSFMKHEIDDDEMEATLSHHFQFVWRADDIPSLYDLKKQRGDRVCTICHEDADDWDVDCNLYPITQTCSACYHDESYVSPYKQK